jgi:hypothetical protein
MWKEAVMVPFQSILAGYATEDAVLIGNSFLLQPHWS